MDGYHGAFAGENYDLFGQVQFLCLRYGSVLSES